MTQLGMYGKIIININIGLKHILPFYKKKHQRKIAVNYCISAVAYSFYKYWLEYHENKITQNVPNLVARIKSDLHYRLLIMSAIDTDP